MILHVPHASTNLLNKELFNQERELLRMTDHFTDDLYDARNVTKIVFGVSRLICDVERFENDEREDMSRFGMGVCYFSDSEGQKLRDVSVDERKNVIENHYHPHHQRLSDAVDEELQNAGSALIVDCHSFPDSPYLFNGDFGKKRPDVCLGTDSFHTPKELHDKVKKFFLLKGYDVRTNHPYSGTMVPLKHYKKNANARSIMIEVNRKLYMDEQGYKTEHYPTLKKELEELLTSLE